MNVTMPIHHHARRHPNKLAMISGGKQLTCEQLDRLVWGAAAYFRTTGLATGDRVAVIIANPMLHMIVTLALARLGAACFVAAIDDSPSHSRAVMQRIQA